MAEATLIVGDEPYRGGGRDPIAYPKIAVAGSIRDPDGTVARVTNALLLNLLGARGRYLRVDPEGFAFRIGRVIVPQDVGPAHPIGRAKVAEAVRARLALMAGLLPEEPPVDPEAVPAEGRGWIRLILDGGAPSSSPAHLLHLILRPAGCVMIDMGVEPPLSPAMVRLFEQIQAAERRFHEAGELRGARSALRDALSAATQLGEAGAEARSEAHVALAELARIKGDALEASTELELAAEALAGRPRQAKRRAAIEVRRGEVLAEAGALGPGIDASREGHRRFVDAAGDDDPDAVLALDQVASLMERAGEPGAAELRGRVQELAVEVFGRSDPLAEEREMDPS